MAKANTARVRKKVRKSVREGIGLPLAVLVLKVHVRAHHLPLRLRQKQLVKLPKSMA